MVSKEYLIHFDHVVAFENEPEEEAWDRMLDAFIEAAVAEGGSVFGGVHEFGTVHTCCEENVTVCQECLEDMSDG